MPNNNSSITTNDGTAGYPATSSSATPSRSSDSASDKKPRPVTTGTQGFPPAPSETEASEPTPGIYSEVAKRISEAKNVLIALSSNPSVDEMAAAIGLSIYLDKLGKRATAIYSGTTPNALEFLKPEDTFESTADTLQDFVIAISKEKADHLRYKLDGSYVKIYITPYRSRISEGDLEFSYGDYNVDLVLALDVANGIDLDSALREHGRIMHDASIVNITTGKPGKFGEIEWNDKGASSVSEMISRLLYHVDGGVKVGKEEATAFLTGIVAATNRFSNANTTPETMRISSLLMESGANQQLVSRNITPDVENEVISLDNHNKAKEDDSPDLDIGHKYGSEDGELKERQHERETEDTPEKDNDGVLDDLKTAEKNLSHAGTETTPEVAEKTFEINSSEAEAPARTEAELGLSNSPAIQEENFGASSTASTITEKALEESREAILQPSNNVNADFSASSDNDEYNQMLEKTVSEKTQLSNPQDATDLSKSTSLQSANPAAASVPSVPTSPDINGVPEISYLPTPGEELLPPPPAPPIDGSSSPSQTSLQANPVDPSVSSFETVGPIIAPTEPISPILPPTETANPVPATSESVEPVGPISPVLPPVEATSSIMSQLGQASSSNPGVGDATAVVSSNTPPSPTPLSGEVSTLGSLGSQPAMQDQVYVPQASDPSAFKIPGT